MPNGPILTIAALALTVSATAVWTANPSANASTARSSLNAVASLSPGWASGGSATKPQSQIAADTECANNSVLLFSARGSGDTYGAPLARNKIGAWTQGAGIELISEGWNVRDLQAIYPAPPVPSFKEIGLAVLAAGGPNAKSAAAVALIVKQFRDAVSNSWQSVKAELEAAYNRCPNRKILLAGYSQGAILLRYIVPRLSAQIRRRIVSVDLFADPTEQRSVDSGLQHPANLDGRLTTEGLDTLSGLVLNGGSFKQSSYPQAGRTYQYCMTNDLVCDATLGNLKPANIANEGKTHASYAFEANGIAAGKRAGSFSKPSPTPPPSPSGVKVAKIWICETSSNTGDCATDVTFDAPEPGAALTCSAWLTNASGASVKVTFSDSATGASASTSANVTTSEAVITVHTQIPEAGHTFTCTVTEGGTLVDSRSVRFTA